MTYSGSYGTGAIRIVGIVLPASFCARARTTPRDRLRDRRDPAPGLQRDRCRRPRRFASERPRHRHRRVPALLRVRARRPEWAPSDRSAPVELTGNDAEEILMETITAADG